MSRRGTLAIIIGSSIGPGSAGMPASSFGHTTRCSAFSDATSETGAHAATVQVQLGPLYSNAPPQGENGLFPETLGISCPIRAQSQSSV